MAIGGQSVSCYIVSVEREIGLVTVAGKTMSDKLTVDPDLAIEILRSGRVNLLGKDMPRFHALRCALGWTIAPPEAEFSHLSSTPATKEARDTRAVTELRLENARLSFDLEDAKKRATEAEQALKALQKEREGGNK